MTHKDKLQFIRKKCIQANPSILDLDFGCVLLRRMDGEPSGHYQVLERGSGFHPEKIWISSRVFGSMTLLSNQIVTETEKSEEEIRNTYEIIGRAIRLADLLYIIEKLELPVDRNWYMFTKTYHLLDDNLEHQSPELISLIYEIIN